MIFRCVVKDSRDPSWRLICEYSNTLCWITSTTLIAPRLLVREIELDDSRSLGKRHGTALRCSATVGSGRSDEHSIVDNLQFPYNSLFVRTTRLLATTHYLEEQI